MLTTIKVSLPEDRHIRPCRARGVRTKALTKKHTALHQPPPKKQAAVLDHSHHVSPA